MKEFNLGRIVGESAYEVAVRNGFSGNEQAWLESLKGAKGDKGEQGEQGVPGRDGTNGSGSDVDLSNYYTKTQVDSTFATKSELPTEYDDTELSNKIDDLEGRIDGLGSTTKTYSKYVVVGVNGQSNSVGYDESPLTLFDKPKDSARIFQYTNELKPLTYCADNIQDMHKVTSRVSMNRSADAFEDANRNQYVTTKGIHLPLANLILDVIPEDYGVIIVPGSVGGKQISAFQKSANASAANASGVSISTNIYTEFINRLKGAMNLSADNIFCGIVWCQGENNCGNTTGASYVQQLQQLVNDINTDLAGYAKQSTKGSITANDWYFYEFPVYYKNLDTQGILTSLKEYFGNRYTYIPNETPYNATLYTSSIAAAHYAQNAFRTVIAPRLFNVMRENGAFLCNAHDNDTVNNSYDDSQLQTKINQLETYIGQLQSTLQQVIDSIDSDIEVPEVETWRKVSESDITVINKDAAGANVSFGSDGTMTISNTSGNQLARVLFNEDISEIRATGLGGSLGQVFMIVDWKSEGKYTSVCLTNNASFHAVGNKDADNGAWDSRAAINTHPGWTYPNKAATSVTSFSAKIDKSANKIIVTYNGSDNYELDFTQANWTMVGSNTEGAQIRLGFISAYSANKTIIINGLEVK